MGGLNPEEMERVRTGLLELVNNLASHGVEHEFEPKNLGLNWRKQVRYFLGWDFVINPRADKLVLGESYRRQVEQVLEGDFSKAEKQSTLLKNEYM